MTRFERVKLGLLKFFGDIGDTMLGLFYSTSSKGLVTEKSLRYLDNAKTALDLIYAKDGARDEKRPIFIYIHGGGFLSGSKNSRRGYCYEWARKGYVVVNVDYQCGARHPFPTFLQQVFHAIDFVFDNVDEYNADLERVVLSGESAGAYIAAFASAFSACPSLYDEFNIDFKHKREFSVRANVLLNGLFNVDGILDLGFPFVKSLISAFSGLGKKQALELLNTPYAAKVSPINYVTKDYPPSVVIKSSRDALAVSSSEFAARLKEKNVKVLDCTCGGIAGEHTGALMVKSKSARASLTAAQDFVLSVL